MQDLVPEEDKVSSVRNLSERATLSLSVSRTKQMIDRFGIRAGPQS